MSTIDEIKSRIDIVELVSETVKLRRAGKNHTGFCPFHQNTRTPAFVVFQESGTWRCFGQCNEGGDIFTFVMKRENCDFHEALEKLADKAGVELKPVSSEQQVSVEANESLRGLLEQAVVFYQHNLMNTVAGKAALEYLREKRGLSQSTIETFGLGYAPHSWDASCQYFRSKGASDEDLLRVGLVSSRDHGDGQGAEGVYDRFRHRLMIPIRDERGRMAGFGARILNPDDVPKFLNSPQTELFDKGRLLYGLDRARKAIRTADQAVIVEGYLDVIALHQAGFENVISPMGTALTEAQLRLLKRYSRRIVLALDADAAGEKATLRGLEVARQAMDREGELQFDARGLVGQEGRLQADIRVATLPDGVDPDELVNEDAERWKGLIENAKPVVIHVMETLAAGQDLEDPKVKSQLANQVLPLIEDVADPIERESYRQRLARLLRIDERVLAVRYSRTPARTIPRERPRDGKPKGKQQAAKHQGDVVEAYSLGVILRRPDMVFRIDRELQSCGFNRLGIDDFLAAEHKELYKLIEGALEQDHAEPRDYVLNGMELTLMELVDRLLSNTEKIEPSEQKVLEDVVRSLLELRRRRLLESNVMLEFLMKEAQDAGDRLASEYRPVADQNNKTLQRLHQAIGRYTNHALRFTAQDKSNVS